MTLVRPQIFLPVPLPRIRLPRRLASGVVLCLGFFLLTGCKRLHVHGADKYLYVVSKGTFLRDRVAAVSNKVVDVHNGERLTLLQHERRFYQVKTSDGKVGWLEEHAVVDQDAYDQFQALKDQHAKDPVVATAILRDELFLHLTAGRKTDHLFLLPENDKLQLLMRASVEKPATPGLPVAKPIVRAKRLPPRPGKPVKKVASGSTIWAAAPTHPDPYTAPDLDPPATPLEDWWLIRDQGGHVGWVLARRLDVDVPDQVAQYSEGKKIVGAYQLNTVFDPGGPVIDDQGNVVFSKKQLAAQKAAAKKALAARRRPHPSVTAPQQDAAPAPGNVAPGPDVAQGRNVAQYVTVTQEYKDGLPFDWDQVRVFIWNVRKHRYETAYRLREQQGYLPVTVGAAHFKDANGRDMGLEPTFTIRTTPDGVVTQDPASGAFHAQTIQETTYRLEGGIVRRADPPPPKPKPDTAASAGAGSSTAPAPGRVRRHPRPAPRARKAAHPHTRG